MSGVDLNGGEFYRLGRRLEKLAAEHTQLFLDALYEEARDAFDLSRMVYVPVLTGRLRRCARIDPGRCRKTKPRG